MPSYQLTAKALLWCGRVIQLLALKVHMIPSIPKLWHLANTATSCAVNLSVLQSELLEPHGMMQLAEAAAGTADNIACLARTSSLAGSVHQSSWSQNLNQLRANSHQKLVLYTAD